MVILGVKADLGRVFMDARKGCVFFLGFLCSEEACWDVFVQTNITLV